MSQMGHLFTHQDSLSKNVPPFPSLIGLFLFAKCLGCLPVTLFGGAFLEVNEVDMLIFRRYFGSEVKGIKVRTVIKIRDNPGTKTWPREQTITTNNTK